MQETPKGMRVHIALAGRRNAGKSRLFNALCGQDCAIVSGKPGTTTDPVEKTLEIKPLGPVVLIDTAGIDDPGELGQKRVAASFAAVLRADVTLLVTDGDAWGPTEAALAAKFKDVKMPFAVVRNKMEKGLEPLASFRKRAGLAKGVPCLDVSGKERLGIDDLVATVTVLAEPDEERPLLADLLPHRGIALLVVPLDSGAPKGRLILPQAQACRDCLDHQQICMLCTPDRLADALAMVTPDVVVSDSQVVKETAAIVPEEMPLTTFSILMARQKGNLTGLASGAGALAKLQQGDNVLIQEACSHHAQKDDIGRVKIPALLQKQASGQLNISHARGRNACAYEKDLKVIIHCGACMLTQKQMLRRQDAALEQSIPMTNYGMAISFCQGVLPRALKLFPDALAAFESTKKA